MLEPRTASGPRTGVLLAVVAAAAALVMACSGGSGPSVDQTGQHPQNWVSTHWAEYAKNPSYCATCHGSLTDPAQAGGIAKVSCFTCHPNGPTHPAGWGDGLSHGRTGVQASDTGMASCKRCHGSDYTGGLSQISCTACHTSAPHPAEPWLSGTPTTASSHNATAAGNAAECWRCHADNARRTTPTGPAPDSVTPGCYNNTLCHGTP